MSEALLEIRRARPLLGTLVQIRAAGGGPHRRVQAAVDAAFARIEQLHALLSYHDPASELSQLNRGSARRARQVDAHTYRVLAAALDFAELSDGAFDPCVGDELERWGCLPRHGRARTVRASWRDVALLGSRRVRFRRRLRLDLGGIAKGYAVDLALEALREAGIDEACVNAGGDLRVTGARAQRITLRHPRAPATAGHTLLIRDGAIATSAAYASRCRVGARELSQLLDPRTRRPYLGRRSVSVRARDCMSADALTKVVLFAPTAVAERALCACEAQAYIQR